MEEAHANRSQNSYCHDFERTGGAYKLELTWYSKDKLILVELHLLIENAALSNAATDIDTENMPTMMSIEAIFRCWKAIHFIHTIFELFLIFSLTSRPVRVTLTIQRFNWKQYNTCLTIYRLSRKRLEFIYRLYAVPPGVYALGGKSE